MLRVSVQQPWRTCRSSGREAAAFDSPVATVSFMSSAVELAGDSTAGSASASAASSSDSSGAGICERSTCHLIRAQLFSAKPRQGRTVTCVQSPAKRVMPKTLSLALGIEGEVGVLARNRKKHG